MLNRPRAVVAEGRKLTCLYPSIALLILVGLHHEPGMPAALAPSTSFFSIVSDQQGVSASHLIAPARGVNKARQDVVTAGVGGALTTAAMTGGQSSPVFEMLKSWKKPDARIREAEQPA